MLLIGLVSRINLIPSPAVVFLWDILLDKKDGVCFIWSLREFFVSRDVQFFEDYIPLS